MTFYNIIFGILFLGAVREVFRVISVDKGWGFWVSPSFWMAATLTLIIFNDVVCTTHILEPSSNQKERVYTFSMKLLDLFSFILLCGALVVLSPSDNSFSINASAHVSKDLQELLFWLLLTTYWIVVLVWNAIGKVYPTSLHIWQRLIPFVMLVLFMILGVVSFFYPGGIVTWILRKLVVVYVGVYFFLYKYLLFGRDRDAQTV